MLNLPDHNVVTVWECPEHQTAYCNGTIEVGPDFFEENGTPVCTGCDCDATYVRTYLNCGITQLITAQDPNYMEGKSNEAN